jgi:hypothetical protein
MTATSGSGQRAGPSVATRAGEAIR